MGPRHDDFQEDECSGRKVLRMDHRASPDGSDCFSDLHDDLLVKIFSHLSLRDAIRTSTLSRSWRVRWRSAVRHLDFRERNTQFSDPESKIREESTAFEVAVGGVLRSVTGPIDSLKLEIRNRSNGCLQRWVYSAVSSGATTVDVSVNDRPFVGTVISLHPLLYWERLTTLKLGRVSVVLPDVLPRSKVLTKLTLNQVRITGGKLGSLISDCPSLTNREIIDCSMADDYELEISSDSLRALHFFWDNEIDKVKLDCPQLEWASIRADFLEHGVDDLLYRRCTKLQFLEIKIVTSLPHDDHLAQRLRHELAGLRHLKLTIDLRTVKDLAEAFCLLNSSPSPTEHEISYSHHYELPLNSENEEDDYRHSLEFWEGDFGWRTLTLHQLNSITLDFTGTGSNESITPEVL